jgi:hypothetical protein
VRMLAKQGRQRVNPTRTWGPRHSPSNFLLSRDGGSPNHPPFEYQHLIVATTRVLELEHGMGMNRYAFNKNQYIGKDYSGLSLLAHERLSPRSSVKWDCSAALSPSKSSHNGCGQPAGH